ncbi:hypothetical protein RJ639_019916 [Escallonia herrerae]|uniref:Phosphate transporter PHO1 n=1 Tax=Escallonia herrerae TaxID=1293975 RepID=A0AA88V782_9ASTE|nr:hypothetical protein RJ639_019916 [Escallonia herrerae]
MVKFSKELEAQLIPEWKDAFVNYWQLKKHVKKIKLARKLNLHSQDSHTDFGFSIFDPIRAAVKKISSGICNAAGKPETIQVSSDTARGEDEHEEEEEEEEVHDDQLSSEEDEVKAFFEDLDEELKKVNQFYKTKESEFLERGEILNKQLQILLDLKQVLVDRRKKSQMSKVGAGVLPWSHSPSGRNNDYSDTSTECFSSGSPRETSQTDDVIAALEKNGINFIGSATRSKTKKGKPKMAMRVDIPATAPARSISAVMAMLWEDLVNNPKKGHGEFINRKKIQCAEKMIRGAFMELYRGLGLVKTYSSLNMLAFVKILKKFDKVAHQQASPGYLYAVKRSHFISSDKVVRLMDEVESLFTKHFANDDRKKAMKFLKPQQRKESHMVTFLVGLFTGSFVTLFSVYSILAHMCGMFTPRADAAYMETVYPIFSMFALLSLHLFMYGCNLFMWKGTRINRNFIFEFQPATALKYRDAFLICTCLMTTVCSLTLLICPLNIFYRSTRYCFIRVIRNIVCSPFYKVLMVDFFMADQLTSQIPLLRHLESSACYFFSGSFGTHRYEICKSGKLYRELAYVISFAPYYWRAMQCARRWFDECDLNHLANLGKYVSALIAAGARITYARQPTTFWMIIVLVTSLLATVYQLYWDFVKDWGLLNPRLENEHLNNVGKYRAVKTVPLPFHETDSDG